MQTSWVKDAGRLLKKNTPEILSAIAIGGVVATVVLAVRATPKAVELIEDEQEKAIAEDPKNPDLPDGFLDLIRISWRCYVPAGIAGLATVACIVGANRTGASRTAALAGAYTILDRTYREYREHVIDELGEKKEREIGDKIMADRIEGTDFAKTQIIVLGGGDQTLCLDKFSGRYFRHDIEKIRKAENDVNALIMQQGYSDVNYFYELLGLESVDSGEQLGWNLDHRLELVFSSHLKPDDSTPCLAIRFKEEPVKEYYKLGF